MFKKKVGIFVGNFLMFKKKVGIFVGNFLMIICWLKLEV